MLLAQAAEVCVDAERISGGHGGRGSGLRARSGFAVRLKGVVRLKGTVQLKGDCGVGSSWRFAIRKSDSLTGRYRTGTAVRAFRPSAESAAGNEIKQTSVGRSLRLVNGLSKAKQRVTRTRAKYMPAAARRTAATLSDPAVTSSRTYLYGK